MRRNRGVMLDDVDRERRMGRRNFLKIVIAVLIITAVINLFRLGFVSYPNPDVALQFFTDKEYAIMRAAADTIIPGFKQAPSASEMGVAASIDKYLATGDPDMGSQFRQLLLLLEHGTTIFGFKLKRFTEMTPEERTDYLGRWMKSDLGIQRQGFLGLKKLVNTFYYIDPRAWQAIGYAGPWQR